MNTTCNIRIQPWARRCSATALKAILLSAFITPVLALANYCGPEQPEGVTIDAEAQRLIVTHREPVRFPDARGRRDARIIATERAKGAVVRYLDQTQQTYRGIEETVRTETARSRAIAGGAPSAEDRASRSQTEVLRLIESSVAGGTLRGLLQLEEQYDADTETLCVALGVSARSAEAAQDVVNWMSGTPRGLDDHPVDRAPGTGSYVRRRTGDW